MKKGLSILLVAAALFGFYGSAVSVNDILACKDYWEEAGAKSTADMNKLEDGLNQLKDNEQAYLDGKKQVVDGEKALKDAEQQLADGEAKLADGRAELAKGEADYAAAPAKLAAGERQVASGEAALAAGEAQLAAGEETLAAGKAERAKGATTLAEAIAARAALANVKKKIAAVEPAYKPWLQKFNKMRKSIVDNPKNPSKGVLYDAGAVGVGLVGDDSHQGILQAFELIKSSSAEAQTGMDTIVSGVKATFSKNGIDLTDEQVAGIITYEGSEQPNATYHSMVPAAYVQQYKQAAQAKAALDNAYTNLKSTYAPQLVKIAQSIGGKIQNVKDAQFQATELRNSDFAADMNDTIDLMDDLAADSNIATVKAIAKQLGKDDMAAMIDGGIAQVKGLADASKTSKSDYDKAYDELKPNASMGQKIGKKVAKAASAILGNSDMAGALTGKQKAALKPYASTKGITGLPNVEYLYATMTLGEDQKDDGKGSLLDNLKAINAGAANGLSQYDDGISDGRAALAYADQQIAGGEADLAKGYSDLEAGRRKLAAGKAELAKGYADYKAAPAKLAAGRQQLAEGEATLADGYKQYEDGKKKLAEGKDQLAQYEDGEQQIRDGLATLVGTKADLDLESIFDRLGGDDDFDNGDKHLEIDEGLAAVEVGRGYQAEDGVLITNEIMGRAVGTGGLLAAGVLAVIAAILSFIKKNKGAGVFAILAAAAGAFGAFYGTQAGTYFSSIAGSTVGATGWIAAGILGAVALVHAIAHFTAGKAA